MSTAPVISPPPVVSLHEPRPRAEPAALLLNDPNETIRDFALCRIQEYGYNVGAPVKSLVAGRSSGWQDCVADSSFSLRAILGCFQRTNNTPGANLGTGWTTFANVGTGGAVAHRALIRMKDSFKKGDNVGARDAAIDIVRGSSQGLGGGVNGGVRGLQVASEVQKCSATKASVSIGKATRYLSIAQTVFFGVFYLCLAIRGTILLYDNQKARGEFDGVLRQNDNDKLVEFLTKKLTAQHEEIYDNPDYLKVLGEEILEKMAAQYQDEYPDLELDDVKVKLKEQLGNLSFQDPLELLGSIEHKRALEVKKFSEFSRFSSGACAERIKKALERGLADRLKSETHKEAAIAELKEMVIEVKAANDKGYWNSLAPLVIGVLGLTVSLPVVVTRAITYAALSFVLGLVMFAWDYFSAKEELDGGPSGRYDKLFIALAMALDIIAFSVSAAVTVVYRMPMLAVEVAFVFTVMSLGVLGYALAKIIQKDKTWESEHISLEEFSKKISSAGNVALDAKMARCFKNLPKEDRDAIRTESLNPKKSQERKDLVLERLKFGHHWLNDLLLRGTAKSIKSAWNTNQKAEALKLQSLLDALKSKDQSAIDEAVKGVEGETLQKLCDDIWYVVERQYYLKDFSKHVAAVVAQNNGNPETA